MVDEISLSGDSLHKFIISPNRAMSWESLVVIFLAISTISIGVGVWFYVNGLPLVLPYTVINLLLLAYALYISCWRATSKEIVTIKDNTVAVETGHKQLEHSYQFQRLWTKVALEKPANSWHKSRLLIRSQGKQLEIGGFLNEDERRGLAKTLVEAISMT